MIIRFRELEIYNFMSFYHASISFENGGYTIVQGVNNSNDDGSLSNGSGKSSIWEAISWCLTGNTIRGNKDVCNLYTNDGACVKLCLCVDGNEYIVRRSKDHSIYKSNIFISVNGEDKSGKGIRDGEAILSTLLPDITSDMIGSVILLGQGLPCRLSSRTPSGRKELLEKLTKSDFMIEGIKNRISKRKDVLSSSMRIVEDNILKLFVEKKFYTDNLNNSKNDLCSLPTVDSYINERNVLSQKLSNLCDTQDGVQKEYELLHSQLQDSQSKKSLITANWYKEKESISSSFSKQMEDSRNAIAELKSELLSFNKEKKRIESITDICPTCGQKIPGVYKPSTTDLIKSIESITESLHLQEDTLSQYKRRIDLELKEIDDRYSESIKSFDKSISELSARIGLLDKQCRDIPIEIASVKSSISSLEMKIEEYQKGKESLETTIRSCEDKLKELSEKELYYNNEKQSIQNHIDIVSKMSTLANRDFRGYLLSNVVEYIDSITKEYSNKVFGSPCVSFILDGNSLDIKLFDKYYESLSGGEKQKVDLIVQFALRKMLCKVSDFSSNIIVLDEIFDNMDTTSSKHIIDFISEELNDLETVFIITHHSDLQIPYDNILKVVKDNNKISRISK